MNGKGPTSSPWHKRVQPRRPCWINSTTPGGSQPPLKIDALEDWPFLLGIAYPFGDCLFLEAMSYFEDVPEKIWFVKWSFTFWIFLDQRSPNIAMEHFANLAEEYKQAMDNKRCHRSFSRKFISQGGHDITNCIFVGKKTQHFTLQ